MTEHRFYQTDTWFLGSCAANQTDARKEENAAQNNVDEGRLRNSAFGEVYAAVYQTDQANQRQNNTENAFNVHALTFQG